MGETFVDRVGAERTPNQWGYNSFASVEGVRAAIRAVARKTTGGRLVTGTWYIWRLADGTFDWTAIRDPSTPGYPAELVEKFSP